MRELQELARRSCPKAIRLCSRLVDQALENQQLAREAIQAHNWEALKAANAFDYRPAVAASAFLRDTGMGRPGPMKDAGKNDEANVEVRDARERLAARIASLAASGGASGGSGEPH